MSYMDNLLDLRTLAIVLTLTSFALSITMFYVWRSSKTYDGFGWWTAGTALGAASFSLIAVHGKLPVLFTVTFSNSMSVGALLLGYMGIRIFFGRSHRISFSFVFLAINTAINIWFLYIFESVVMRITIISLNVAILAVMSAAEFHKVDDSHRGRINLVARCTYLLFALVMITRAILTYNSAPITSLFTPDWVQSWSFIAFTMFAILWTFNYLILNSQRLQDELQMAQSELEQQAITDFLTGISNSRNFFERGEREFTSAKRFGYPISVVMLDLDGFKEINDKHGHAAGDEILKAVATACKERVRSIDTFARLGGDEFAILLSHSPAESARIVAETLRETVASVNVSYGEDKLFVTTSAGVAEIQPEDLDIQSLLVRADEQLYRAKRSGKDKVLSELEPSELAILFN